MTAKNFLTAFGALMSLYGLFFLFANSAAVDLYGATDMIRDANKTPEGAAAAANAISNFKMIGGLLLSAGIMGLLARDARASYGRRAIFAFIVASSAMFLIFSLMGLASGAPRAPIAWFDMVLNILFLAGGLYFLSKEKDFEMP